MKDQVSLAFLNAHKARVEKRSTLLTLIVNSQYSNVVCVTAQEELCIGGDGEIHATVTRKRSVDGCCFVSPFSERELLKRK
jgi:hypothetical protein